MLLSDGGQDLSRGNDVLCPPAIGGADIHILDEAQGMPPLPEIFCHGQDAAFIHAPFDNHIDLDR